MANVRANSISQSIYLLTVIRSIVTYVSETWVVKESIIQKVLGFQRKILRGIFGPTKENQTWRIKNNEELDKLINN